MQAALALPAPAIAPALIARVVPSLPEPASARDTAAPLMLFGLDRTGKAHGGRFDVSEAGTVERAADLMDHFLITADTDALRDLATKLPAGRLFGSGRAFVPFIKAALYDQLLAAAGIPITPRPAKAAAKPADVGDKAEGTQGRRAGGSGAGEPGGKGDGADPLSLWAALRPGDLVLAEDEDEGGYYLAEVVATKANDYVVLVWEGYPNLPEFSRARWALALLHPEAVARVVTP